MIDPDNSGSDRAAADVLVLGGIVVTMDARRSILPDGALALRGDSIAALGPRAQIAAAYRATTILDATGCLAAISHQGNKSSTESIEAQHSTDEDDALQQTMHVRIGGVRYSILRAAI